MDKIWAVFFWLQCTNLFYTQYNHDVRTQASRQKNQECYRFQSHIAANNALYESTDRVLVAITIYL